MARKRSRDRRLAIAGSGTDSMITIARSGVERMVAIAGIGLLIAAGSAHAVEMPADAVGASGGFAVSANYSLGFTAGLPVCGVESSSNYDEAVGLWHWVRAYVSGTGGEVLQLPTSTQLSLAGPNPFSEMTTLRFQIAEDQTRALARLEIFDVNGRSVSVLLDEPVTAGWYTVVWDRENRSGRRTPDGIYFARFRAGDFTKTVRLVATR